MKYPSTILKGDHAKGSCISIAIAIGKEIFQDAGARMIHLGKNTQSTILSKSISGYGGRVNYRGKVEIKPEAKYSKAKVECDTMILDQYSKSDTVPSNIVSNNTSSIEHEAVVSKISEKQIYYLQSRGLTEDQAKEIIILGFIEPFAKEIPLEYAVELNNLIKMELEGNIG
uniref:SUF system FeS cluster assembly SufBD core domain-containing protein n=1 Tax=Biomphalaria glabrata TaxID=6526 RepID=A0A2C9KQP9_BIOGL